MDTWIRKILDEMQAIPETEWLNPLREVGPEDCEVGVANDAIKALYTLHIKKQQRVKFIEAELVGASSKERVDELMREHTIEHTKGSAIANLFWNSIRDDLNLWDKADIGIRKDWKIVYTERKSLFGPTIAEILGHFGPPHNDGGADETAPERKRPN